MLTDERVKEIADIADSVINERSFLAPQVRALLRDREELKARIQELESSLEKWQYAAEVQNESARQKRMREAVKRAAAILAERDSGRGGE